MPDVISEKVKQLAGEPYLFLNDPDLPREGMNARRLCRQFNDLKVDDVSAQRRVLRNLFGSTKGDEFFITQPFYCDYGYNISLGKNVYMNTGCVILDCNKVTIGDDTLLGPNVQLFPVSHPVDPVERKKGYLIAKPISIGNNCLLGGGTIVCAGVKIGDNVTIGAGSVVTHDLPNNCVAAGNPARIIRLV